MNCSDNVRSSPDPTGAVPGDNVRTGPDPTGVVPGAMDPGRRARSEAGMHEERTA